MMFTLLPLDHLPAVPQHFVDQALAIVADPTGKKNKALDLQKTPGYNDRSVTLLDGTVTKSLVGEIYEMGPDWEDWVRTNIISRFIETGIRNTRSKNGSTTHGAHADNPIKWKFFYLLDEGGTNVVTSFYLQKGHLAVREDNSVENIVRVTDYQDIVPIDSVRIPVGRWMFFDTRVIHGVQDILGSRTTLVVSVNPEDVTFNIQLKDQTS